jgi:hypothetical protein
MDNQKTQHLLNDQHTPVACTQTNEFYMQSKGLNSNINGDMMHWIQKLSLRSHWNNETFPTSYWVQKRQGTTAMANVLGAAVDLFVCW